MYFNFKKTDTNLDNELNKDNNLSPFFKHLNKKKLIMISSIVVLLLILVFFLFINRKVTNYLILNGEEVITLYVGSDYIETGFKAYNSKNKDLTKDVDIKSTLDIDKVGEYEITYSLGEIIKTRKIKVIEKSESYTYIYLKTVNNNVNVYLKVGEKYTEPGYQVFSDSGQDLTNQVKVTGTVDTSKKGNYKLTYSVIDSNNVTVTASRTVIVMDMEISLSINNQSYTNDKVTINVGIVDNYFDYMLLPNNTKVTSSTYAYSVSENGKYTFTVYNTKGSSKQASIEIKNIDRTSPSGSCMIDQDQNGSFITVKASDQAGIKKYEYNNQSYTNSTIKLSTFIASAKVRIYDNANNAKDINCTVVPKVYINNIQKDGVIITVNAKKVNNEITGYYFSYTNQRPDKNNGGYIATNKETIDVVRLPGTTYVWVEDTKGKISDYKTITIDTNEILITREYKYDVLKGTSLATFLSNHGWSIEGLNDLMARSVRAAGLYSKEAAATSALTLIHVLAQKYKIKLPYESAGLYSKVGVNPKWGDSRSSSTNDNNKYYGLDCSAFINWAYANAGYGINDRVYFWGSRIPRLDFKKENGEIGDILVYGYGNQTGRHVQLIIGKTEDYFLIAEAGSGIVIDTHSYSRPNNYEIQKANNLTDLTKNNGYYKLTDYPSGI